MLHIWRTLDTYLSPVNHNTQGGEYKRSPDSYQLIIFAPNFIVSLEFTWEVLI